MKSNADCQVSKSGFFYWEELIALFITSSGLFTCYTCMHVSYFVVGNVTFIVLFEQHCSIFISYLTRLVEAHWTLLHTKYLKYWPCKEDFLKLYISVPMAARIFTEMSHFKQC